MLPRKLFNYLRLHFANVLFLKVKDLNFKKDQKQRKQDTMRFWYFVTLLFCIYNIKLMLSDAYKVVYYVKYTSNDSSPFKFSICLPFCLLNLNSFLHLNNNSNVNLQQLVNEIKKLIPTFVRLKLKNANERTIDKIEDEILKAIESKMLYFHNFHFCLIFKDPEILINFSIHGLKYAVKFFAFQEYPHLFFRNSLLNDRQIFLIKIIDLESPYSSCLTFKNKEIYSRFSCINNCLKANRRSAKYFYSSNELAGLIDLNLTSSLIASDEEACFEKDECKHADCEFSFSIVRSTIEKILNNSLFNSFLIKVIQARLYLEIYEFYFQLIGIVCLLTKLSVYQTISSLINIFYFKFYKFNYYKILKYLNLMLCNIFTLAICIQLVSNYLEKTNHKVLIEHTKFQSEINPLFNMIFCLDVSNDFVEEDDLNLFENDNKTFQQMINETNDGFDGVIKRIYLDFAGDLQELKWKVTSKVLFRQNNRCYQIKILQLNLLRYQSLLGIAKIIIKLNNSNRSKRVHLLHLISEGRNYHSKIFNFFNGCSIRLQITKKLESNEERRCFNYKNLDQYSCDCKQSCIERCISQKYFQKHSSIFLSNFVLDKEHFEGNNLNYPISRLIDYSVIEECEKDYPLIECEEINFKCLNIFNTSTSSQLNVDLTYEVVTTVESENSIYDLLIDLANIEGVFLGFSILNLLFIIFYFLKDKFKYLSSSSGTISIYMICFFAFYAHNYYILNDLLNGEKSQNQYFELMDDFEIPSINFCYSFEKELIDENYELNANYLEQITKDISLEPEFIFKKFVYQNKSGQLITLKSNFTSNSSDFEIRTLFMNDRKCFSINFKKILKERDFIYSNLKYFLRISFKQFTSKNVGPIYFYRIKQSMEFSKQIDFRTFPFQYLADLKIKFYQIDYSDNFSFLKYPLSLFYSESVNDVTSHIDKMRQTFKNKYNYATLKLPLENDFDLPINDALFDQFNQQIVSNSNQLNKNFNFKRTFLINDIENYSKSFLGFNLYFHPVFYRKILIISNQNSYAKLTINILNSLAIWLDFGFLEFHVHIYKLQSFFKFLYMYLNKLKCKVNPL